MVQECDQLVIALIKDNKIQITESEKLELMLKRTVEKATAQLVEMDEDMQYQATRLEEKIRAEEQSKLEAKVVEVQKQHEAEVTDLQAVIDRMKKFEDEFWQSNSRGDITVLKQQLDELNQENSHLRSSLLENRTNYSILQVELDKVKNDLAAHHLDEQRTKEVMEKLTEENQAFSSQLQMLQEANSILYDSNDGLRTALESNPGLKKKKHSPDEPLVTRVKLQQENGTPVISYSSYNGDQESMEDDEEKYKLRDRISDVEIWANCLDRHGSKLDSYSDADYDSDCSDGSQQTMQYSYSCVLSDSERSETDTDRLSRPISRCSSTASSRRRLPAFSPQKRGGMADHIQTDGPLYRLVLAGDAGSGKSSFLQRLCMNEFKGDIPTTLGVDFQVKKLLVDGEVTTLQIWDTAGQERFRSIAKSYFRKANGVLLLYDVTSQNSFLNVREWIDEVKNATDTPVPIILIGNKTDLRNEMPKTKSDSVFPAHGEKLAMAYNALFCETSAKDGTNVVEAVLHLAREAKKNAKDRNDAESTTKLPLNKPAIALNNCCKT
eukprot:gi/632938471/ref/XP_007905095.1/ PREDICTED: ras and EF-hand domain-containing protein-like isoform X2 [Callorhinchus milii]